MKLSTTRQAIHDALAWGWQQGESSMVQYLTYLTRIEKSIRRGEPCGDFLEAGFICAAVNILPGHIGGWLKFAYGPDDLTTVQDALASQLRFSLFPLSSSKKHARYFSLAQTAVEGYRLRVWEHRDLPIKLYCDRMGIDEKNWVHNWHDHREKCLNAIKGWDREGVGQVSRMVQSLKGNNEERPSEVLKDLQNYGF
jgi:hypothetical protein